MGTQYRDRRRTGYSSCGTCRRMNSRKARFSSFSINTPTSQTWQRVSILKNPRSTLRLTGLRHKYFVSEALDLPANKQFVLLVRSEINQNGRDAAIEDYAGNGFFSDGFTQFWPRDAQRRPTNIADFGNNTFASRDQAWARLRYEEDDGHHKDAWEVVETQGGLGYAAGADLKYAPGTPGYENNCSQDATGE